MTEQTIPPSSKAAPEFIPGQFQYLVEHDEKRSPTEIFQSLKSTEASLTLRGAPLTFRDNAGRPKFSILPLTAPEANATQTLSLAESLARSETSALVEPNWLTFSGQHGQGTGGTGAWPVPCHPLPTLHPHAEGTRLIRNLVAQKPEMGKHPITLAILDTLPKPADLARLHTQAGWPHIQNFLNRIQLDNAYPMPPLTCHSPLDPHHHIAGHPYRMVSHGLFAAYQALMVADQIAPPGTVEITLYEALDAFGIGDASQLYRLLAALSHASHPRQLVINLSLSVATANSEIIRRICDNLEEQGVVIVAAAGNNSTANARQTANLPAAFESVIGVAALAHEVKGGLVPASYSNLSDSTSGGQHLGFAAIGGGQVPHPTNPAGLANHDVAGPFIDDFPHDPAPSLRVNHTGWAYWAGTSFAAPKVAALAAVLLSTGAYATSGIRAAIEADIRALCAAGNTADGEPMICL